ncbi:putative phage abortive infection protein [Pseudoalteromonas rubra]|uniref:putative phage abortive infection protein n=1 Tax=Pseudoalteromonas rubra TaxID=43658 RepID=UPI000F79576B|nr:putative phage abortive infection protein [Pseudoalteromonas rubra]
MSTELPQKTTSPVDEEIKKTKKAIQNSIVLVSCTVLALLFLYLGWFWVKNDLVLSSDVGHWGNFGDFFGGILNPLLAFFAFYWLTRSVAIQQTELSETRKVLGETEKAARAQAITQQNKRFEDSFYSLLNQFNQEKAQLRGIETHGRDPVAKPLTAMVSSVINQNSSANTSEIRDIVQLARRRSDGSNHVFRILYQILKFILVHQELNGKTLSFVDAIGRPVTESEKFYASIVRSFMDKGFTQLLAIICFCDHPNDDFLKYQQLIERYQLLEHMRFDKNFLYGVVDNYNPSAFGNNEHVKTYLQSKNV